MRYDIQKIIMKNCTVYNILHESTLLGHIIENEDSKVLVQTDEIPIIPLVESFGFEGKFWLVENEDYKLVELKPTPDFIPLYEFKVINFDNYFLSES